MANYASKLIEIATADVGYIEKASNSNLDSKTGNAGSKNYTKYARDLAKISGFYNGNKNGYDWCDVFVDWCFVQAFGVEEAKKLINHGQYGAGCRWSSNYFRNVNRFYNKPKVGDVIFFGAKGQEYHTGIVYKVDSNKVYTIEGNTSGGSGVVANGGGVFKKSYSITSSKITGYGRPNYDAEPVAEEKQPTTDTTTDTTNKPSATTLKAGQAINLRNEPLYATAYTSKVAGTIYGTYYAWDNAVINGRVRITTYESKVGVKGQVTGFIDATVFADAPKTVHKVVRGDTLSKIAKKYGTTAKKIYEANKSKYPTMTMNLIVVGWELTIPK